jgi:hypothetical protein
VKLGNVAWLRLLVFSWLTALASSVVLAAVLVGVTMVFGDTEPPRIPEQRSGDVVVSRQSAPGAIADAERAPESK